MAKELPYFQFEPAEYLSGDILLCSYEAQGVFVHLMSLYWQRNCELTLVKAQRLLKSDGLTELIEEGILILEGENQDIIISFLDKQFEQLTKRKKRLSDAGKKGAEIKAAKATLKPPLSDDETTLKQPEEIREEEKRKEEIIKEKKKEETPKKEYGKPEINEVVNYLTEKLGVTLDGSVKTNRQFANHLINKIKKDYPDKNAVDNIKILIDKGLKDKFHGKNITGFQYLYNNLNKIINSIKNDKSKSPTSADQQAYTKQRRDADRQIHGETDG